MLQVDYIDKRRGWPGVIEGGREDTSSAVPKPLHCWRLSKRNAVSSSSSGECVQEGPAASENS